MLITVTVKTMKQQTAKVDIDETSTVLDLKGKIQESLGAEFPSDCQKLIFRGKILQDTGIIGELGLTQAGFVVVMVSKPKSVPAPVEPPQPAPGPSTAPVQPAATPPTPPGPSEAEGASGAPVQSFEQMVDNLMEMTGNSLPREHVKEVLQRSQNNPVVAGAILVGGIEDLSQPAPGALPPAGQPPAPQGGLLSEGQTSDLTQAAENPLNFLRSQPQFQQLRTLLQSNPSALPQILTQIQQTNPDLFTLINSNRTAFMELMNDPSTGPEGQSASLGAPPGGPGGPGTISVTPTEMEAINRLKALGFPEHMVVQAYFACEKNEEMAANFLLSENQQD